MKPVKRKMLAVGGAAAAALALAGCAPAGYDAANYGAEYDAVAAQQQEPAAAPDADAEAEAGAEDGDKAENQATQQAPKLSEKERTSKLKAVNLPRMGKAVQDEDGKLLYRFDDDSNDPAESTCYDKCAEVWPPALTDGKTKLEGVRSGDVGTVERKDGTKQLTLDGWPLYRYVGDVGKLQWKGQGVGDKWFIVQPDGKKNLSCLPEKTPKAVEPPSSAKKSAAKQSSANESAAGDYSY